MQNSKLANCNVKANLIRIERVLKLTSWWFRNKFGHSIFLQQKTNRIQICVLLARLVGLNNFIFIQNLWCMTKLYNWIMKSTMIRGFTCKWLLTWYIVSPVIPMAFNIPFGVAPENHKIRQNWSVVVPEIQDAFNYTPYTVQLDNVSNQSTNFIWTYYQDHRAD